MKSINVCLIIFLITLGSINSFEFSSLSEVQELKGNLFGSNLIETISLTLKSNESTAASQEILQMLTGLKNDLKKDQEHDTQIFLTKKAQFDQHINKLAYKIAVLKAKIIALTAEIFRLANLIKIADKNILSFRKRISNLQLLLKQLEVDNNNDNVYYKNRINSLQRVFVVFSRVVGKLRKLVGSVSAAKVPTHVRLTASEKRDIEWKKKNPKVLKKSFLQIENQISTELAKESKEYSMFIETTLNADQGALQKLMDLISKLQKDVLEKKAKTVKHLESINAVYLLIKNSTNKEIALNNIALVRQTANRAAYVSRKAELEKQRAAAEARRDLLIKEKTLNENLRKNLEATYLKEKALRGEEYAVVEKLVKIVENRLVKRLQ